MLTYWKYSLNNYKTAIVFIGILIGISIVLGELIGIVSFSIILGALFGGSYISWKRYVENYKRKNDN